MKKKIVFVLLLVGSSCFAMIEDPQKAQKEFDEKISELQQEINQGIPISPVVIPSLKELAKERTIINLMNQNSVSEVKKALTILPNDLRKEILKYTHRLIPFLFIAKTPQQMLNLLALGASTYSLNKAGNTVLLHAIQKKRPDVAYLLLQAGADHNEQNAKGDTPLQAAISEGQEEIVKLLLEKGANPNLKGKRVFTPLSSAAGYGEEGIVKLLLDNGATFETKGRTALMNAAMKGHKVVIKLLLEKGANPNIKNGNDTALFFAAKGIKTQKKREFTEIVKLLLENGADPNTEYETGDTALIFSIIEGEKEIVDFLLEKTKVNVNVVSDTNSTALMFAALKGYEDIVKKLLKAGADKTIRSIEGKTANDYAKTEAIKKLLK